MSRGDAMELMKTIHCRYLPLIALLAGLAFQCTQETEKPAGGTFNIYLVRNPNICPLKIDEVAPASIDLPVEPVATVDDIAAYEILRMSSGRSPAHAIIFTSDVKARFGYENCCFVVVVNGVRRYQGEYWANFMSTFPPNVILNTYTSSEFHLLATTDAGSDKINDPRIILALIDAGVDVVDVDIGSQ